MFVVMVTGGLASGKKTACEYLRSKGASYMDLDVITKEEQGNPLILEQLAEAFGQDIITSDGATLNRALLAKRAFADKRQTQLLNSICWPPVIERLSDYLTMSTCQPLRYPDWLVVEIPMLIESLSHDLTQVGESNLLNLADDFIIVDTPEYLRLERAINRGMSAADARARIAMQATDANRQNFANQHNATIIDNTADQNHLYKQLDAWYADRIPTRLF